MPKASIDCFTTHYLYYKENFGITESIKKLVTNLMTFTFTYNGDGCTNQPGLVAKRGKRLKALI